MTEWQLYAQKLEGDQWTGDKLDRAKLDKMSGMFLTVVRTLPRSIKLLSVGFHCRSATWTVTRAYAGSEERRRRGGRSISPQSIALDRG